MRHSPGTSGRMAGVSRLTNPRENDSSQPPNGVLLRLGIRSSLLLSFGAMTGVMALAVLAALYFSSIVNTSVRDILESQLPITVGTLQVARAADALTASGLSLSTLSTQAERDDAFRQVNHAEASLDAALEDLKKVAGDTGKIPSSLFAELQENLRRLQNIVDERIMLQKQQTNARRLLLANLLTFQQHLTYRARILEGDGDVIKRLMEQPKPPVEKIASMAGQLATLLPVARFYATVESVNGRLLAASQSLTQTLLNTSRRELAVSLANLYDDIRVLPEELGRELVQPLADLKALVNDEDGLVRLRERELLLLDEIQAVNVVNKDILQRVNAATAQMVSSSYSEMTRTGASLMRMRQRSMLLLIFVAGLGLFGVACLMYFYVNRHVIARLAWLSASMQDVAAGRLDIALPPAGGSELGRLGASLRQFRDIAAEARAREAALQASNQRATQAMEALEAKTAELELANSKLTELSIRDPLTGLFNRRRFDDALELEWARAGHGGKDVGLIILDVDFFKSFNDRYGHQAGDECLKKLAAVFMNHARRAGDVAARYGGEEFCMVCPYTDMDKAGVLAHHINETVLDLDLPHEDSPFGKVTVSLGYAAAVPDGKSAVEDLLHAADLALYEAKAANRNCVRGVNLSSAKERYA